MKIKLSKRIQQWLELLDTRSRIRFDKRARSKYRARSIRQELRELGLNRRDMLKPETSYIGTILHPDEKILGVACGHLDEGGSALLAVTSLRIIYLNQIPMYTKMDEINYEAVNAVSSDMGSSNATVTLHTGMGDFTLHSVNVKAASRFVDSVERVSIDIKKDRRTGFKTNNN